MNKSYLVIELPNLPPDAVERIHGFLGNLMDAFESQYHNQLKPRYYSNPSTTNEFEYSDDPPF